MADVRAIIEEVLRIEGEKYTNDPADSGGPTKWGITQKTLAAYRGHHVTADDVKALTYNEAYQILWERYVSAPGYHRVFAVSPRIAAELVDTAVNAGEGTASRWLQRSLNALNRGGKDYADIRVDGRCGDKTIAALYAFLRVRGTEGEDVLYRLLNCLQGAFYLSLAEQREKDERFLFGWLAQRVTC